MLMRPQRREFIQGLAAGAASLLAALPGAARASTAFGRDPRGRAIVSVNLNGRGPFRLVLDTGANRTVLTPRVLHVLGLSADAGRQAVLGAGGRAPGHIVGLDHLQTGAFERRDVSAVVMSGEMVGAYDGLLGMDALAGSRLAIDFEQGVFEVGPGGGEAPPGFDPVPGRLRYGQLLETQIEIRDVAASALIDSGSQGTIANAALLARLPEAPRSGRFVVVGVREGQATAARVFSDVKVGPLRIKELLVYPGEIAPYRDEAGREQPGLLLGIDALSAARAVAIDFARAELQIAIGEQNLVWARGPEPA